MPTFNTDTPKPGYVYDSVLDTWFPLAGVAVQTLDGLTDVVISSAVSGQTIVYNGTNWVNASETGDVSAISSGTGITVTSGTGPIPSIAVDDTLVATTSNTMTLSNKTLTTPTLNNPSVTSGTFIGGTFTSNPNIIAPLISGGTSATVTETYPVLLAPEERWNIAALSAGSSVNLDVLTSAVWYYTSSSSSNWTLNVRGGASTSLNNILAIGDSITTVFFATNGTTPFYQTALLVDGATSGVSVKWQNGVAPSAGNTSSIDIYSFTIAKTANATFTAFGSQTKFA